MTDRTWAAIIGGLTGIITAIISGWFLVNAAVTSKSSQLGQLSERARDIERKLEGIEDVGGVPIGSIVPFAGPLLEARLLRQGWLPCDGREVSRREYRDLFETIGTAWGVGDGVNTFRLPDLGGRFLRGVDESGENRDPDAKDRHPSSSGGNERRKVGSLQPEAVGSHGHPISDPGHFHAVRWGIQSGPNPTPGKAVNERSGDERLTSTDTPETHLRVTEITVVDNVSPETRPENVYVYFAILAGSPSAQ